MTARQFRQIIAGLGDSGFNPTPNGPDRHIALCPVCRGVGLPDGEDRRSLGLGVDDPWAACYNRDCAGWDDLALLEAAVLFAAGLRETPTPDPEAPDAEAGPDADAEDGRFVDWPDFWSKDRSAPEWLHEDVLARGRGHAIYAKHGAGKSLFALWLSTELVKAGHVVVYGDWEMGADDLYERLSDMGHGPETDLSRLRYLLLPNLQPLNSAEGAQEFGAILDEVQAAWPDRHMAVIIDTIGRAVVGEENSNDTILGFYRHCGMELRRRGVTWVRLDHAGHEGTHARGGSAKGDDVDVVWQLAPTDDGIELRADKRRMSWVPEQVALSLVTDPVLKYVPVAQSWLAGTHEAAQALDRLEVATDASWRVAQKALKDAGEGRRAQVIRAALRYRRMLENGRDPPRDPPLAMKAGPTPGLTPEIPHSFGRDPLRDPPGPTSAEPVGPIGGPPRGPTGAPLPIPCEDIRGAEGPDEATPDALVHRDRIAQGAAAETSPVGDG